MKIIIIGSIAAGVSAAARLAAAQRGAQITVYEKGGFYSRGTGSQHPYLGERVDRALPHICAMRCAASTQPPAR